MPAPRKGILRNALPEQRIPAPPIITISRPLTEVFDTYQGFYDTFQKEYKKFERRTWDVKIRNLTRVVFMRVAAMRSRRARLNYILKGITALKNTGVEAFEFERTATWPPVLEEYPTWYNNLATPALRVELQQRINALTTRIANELGDFEMAKMTGKSIRRDWTVATHHEMKWLEIQGQIKEYDSMMERLGDVDVRPLNTE